MLETARGGILKRGLAFDRCDVGVLLNISDDHLGLDGVDTIDDLARVKAVVAHAASRAVVLNAEDPRCVAIGAALDPAVDIVYFSCDAAHPVLVAHLARGGRAAWLERDAVMLADGKARQRLLAASAVPAALDGRARHNLANALAAAAALMASKLSAAMIADGLRSFVSDARRNPMRTNVYQVGGVQVIVDYAHNPAAFAAQAATARALTSGCTVAVVTAPGDRRDEDFRRIGKTCAAGFDQAIFYEWESEHRGRAPGQRAELMHAAASAARGGANGVAVELDPAGALRAGLARCRPGDVLLYACGSSVAELVDALRPVDPACAERISETLA